MGESQEHRIKQAVRRYYGERAGADPSCCGGPEPCCQTAEDASVSAEYTPQELSCMPRGARGSSLGCGNPLAFSDIQEGEVVLDIGSGAGMDAILAARKVGQRGKVIGLDMTPEMIERAVQNAEAAGVGNIAEFRLGEMEDMPIEDESVDWIISNCVINLSPDKERVSREAYRVLKPGGKMLVSDLVSSGLPDEMRRDLFSWAQCLGGTVEESEYLEVIREAGFEDVAVVDKVDVTEAMLGTCCGGIPSGESRPSKVYSIKVRATKVARSKTGDSKSQP